MRIGVIGLGTMGAPMARHLLEAGHQVAVHNRTRERELPLAELGAARRESPAAAARDADAVLTCVSRLARSRAGAVRGRGSRRDDPTRRDRGRLLDRRHPRSPAQLAGRLAEQGVGIVDAPVSGGSEGAERGHADRVRRRRSRPPPAGDATAGGLLRPDHASRPAGSRAAGQGRQPGDDRGNLRRRGRGHRLAESAGLPLEQLVEALSGGAAGSWVLTNRSGNMIRDSYPLGFKLALHRKDLGIALDEAGRAGLDLEISKLVAGQEDALIDGGFGDEDVSALARAAKRRARSPAD